MSVLPSKNWTVEEYLAFERASEEKHEFVGGEVYLMTGASRKPNLITGNVNTSLNNQLRELPCEVYINDMRVRIQKREYVYPDVIVMCGEAQLEDEHLDTLLNPTVIIEVLSPSTEQYDRGRKFRNYRLLDSLQEYVLVAQDSARVERYLRQADGQWLFSDTAGLEASVDLISIGCTLLLADIYNKVTFDVE